jgi:hypothetical protein
MLTRIIRALPVATAIAATISAYSLNPAAAQKSDIVMHKDPPEAGKAPPPATCVMKLKLLSKGELEHLLNQRLNGSLGHTLIPFANMFFVRSKMDLDTSIGLTCDSKDAEQYQLENAFPSTYRPTLRELLDAIAMQTKTHWSYNAKDQVAKSDRADEKEVAGIVNFVFEPAETALGYGMTVPKDWIAYDRTNWIMYVPPIAPVAMDLHISGRLSAQDKAKEAELFSAAPIEAALDSLHRLKHDATSKDLTKTKVGIYDAYFFEADMPNRTGKQLHWRQWHFMVGSQLCYVISTIFDDQNGELYPAVQAMLKTFRIEK